MSTGGHILLYTTKTSLVAQRKRHNNNNYHSTTARGSSSLGCTSSSSGGSFDCGLDPIHKNTIQVPIDCRRRRPNTTTMIVSLLLYSSSGCCHAAVTTSSRHTQLLPHFGKATSAFVIRRQPSCARSKSQKSVHVLLLQKLNQSVNRQKPSHHRQQTNDPCCRYHPRRRWGMIDTTNDRLIRQITSSSSSLSSSSPSSNTASSADMILDDGTTTTTTDVSSNRKSSQYDVINRERGISDKYDPSTFEHDIYQWWEQSGCFQPDAQNKNRMNDNNKDNKKQPYVLPMPPPNVTGRLHMGHAIFVALQDVLARFHRMRGRPVLWLPGTDHAGIATQLQVEKLLLKEGTTRETIGRDAFVKRVWDYKNEQGGFITQQLRSLGASADWSRERFTMDADLSNAVIEAFVRLHEKGLIYRGEYMVNWAPMLKTAVSDLEVEYTDELGKLYYFKYMIEGSEGAKYMRRLLIVHCICI
jgi:tRNA synthetases class I (I, L, M and V)